MKIMDLEALFLAARTGQPDARGRLCKAVQARVWGYFAYNFSPDDAQELMQTTVEIVLMRLGDLQPLVSFERWLLGVARYLAYREFESREQRARLGRALERELAESETGPSSALLRFERLEIMFEEIQRLPESMRVVIEHELAEGDLAELAASEDVKPSTLRSRRFRGKGQLGDMVRARCGTTAVSKLTDNTSSHSS